MRPANEYQPLREIPLSYISWGCRADIPTFLALCITISRSSVLIRHMITINNCFSKSQVNTYASRRHWLLAPSIRYCPDRHLLGALFLLYTCTLSHTPEYCRSIKSRENQRSPLGLSTQPRI
ncbi:hypothetical protein EJ02DRAFT_46147 [Clathrospora elynae]|uniref:Uncharacterized protein n=1 Tax=Clathrospora elynae TaxID=706981 RepID=A0A6A5T0J9_9PLEO|nr:hypothetical protein EJ02DRAFT_46147 [Clathrospora elynae]